VSLDLSDEEEQQIEELMLEHSLERGVEWRPEAVRISLREKDVLVGGLTGRTAGDWLYISRLIIATQCRARGYGRKLIEEAEQIAIERGCHGVWLNTHSFQAPEFYERLGYRRFGVLDDYPPGHRRIFYFKLFPQADADVSCAT
jgi:ribosomal protein S18 acetylase RimI-like enzyme